MTADADADATELERCQWLFDHLADHANGSGNLPPQPLVQALAQFALNTPFDLGWATSDYDHRTEVTTWTGLVANATVLVEFHATAALVNSNGWNGNRPSRPTEYAQEPAIEIDLTKLDDVTAVHVSTRGSSDASDYEQRLRQSWTLSFGDGTTREYQTDANDRAQPTDREVLCQRLAQHL